MENMHLSKLVVADIDNTLFFTDHALHLAEQKKFGRELTKDEYNKLPRPEKRELIELTCTEFIYAAVPNTQLIEKLRQRHRSGAVIFILTARPDSVEASTIQLLRENGVPFDGIYHNPLVGAEQRAFKPSKFPEITSGYEVIEVYDDKRDILESYKPQSGSRVERFWVNPEGLLRI